MACPICCDDTDLLCCSYCGFGSCYACVARFILGQMKEPCCMGCNKVWSREFVMQEFDASWVRNKFLPHIGVLIREQERTLLPCFQDEASNVLKIRALVSELQELPSNEKLMKKYKKDPGLIERYRQQKSSIKEQISSLKKLTVTYGGMEAPRAEKRAYVMKCPSECRGYLDDKYVCGVCSARVCESCSAVLGSGTHRCKKEDVLSAQALKAETKPCPKCMVPIFKAGGCSQVWCTQCHTAFDWATGKVEVGMIHNPHYYEWLAANNGAMEVDEVACGEMPNPTQYYSRISKSPKHRELMELYRMVYHVEQVVLRFYDNNRIRDNFDLRIQYLVGDFDDDVWATKLMNREKKRMKSRALRELLEMVVTVMKDLVRQVMFEQACENVASSYGQLKNYFEEMKDKIIDVHRGKVPDNLADLFGSY